MSLLFGWSVFDVYSPKFKPKFSRQVYTTYLAHLSRRVPTAMSKLNPSIVWSPTPRVKMISVCFPVTNTLKKGNSTPNSPSSFNFSTASILAVIKCASIWLTGITGMLNLAPIACAKSMPTLKQACDPGPIATATAWSSYISAIWASANAFSTMTGSC